MSLPTPAQAVWNQRQVLTARLCRLRALVQAVGRPTDLAPFQWAQLIAFAVEFAPDLIVELGRGRGNSTCCFLEACALLKPVHDCGLKSFCRSDDWYRLTVPRLRDVCPDAWFEPGVFHSGDLCQQDFSTAIAGSRRTLVFWDAHGFEVADAVLGHLLPLLESRSHVVIMHDISDTRYCSPPRAYDGCGLWQGENGGASGFWIGHIFSRVAQTISIIDFTTRNQLPLHSADESLHTELGVDPARLDELRRRLGDDFFALAAHWFWFSLNEATRPLTFPRRAKMPAAAAALTSPYQLIKKVLRRAAGSASDLRGRTW